jgi:hypothetical protein
MKFYGMVLLLSIISGFGCLFPAGNQDSPEIEVKIFHCGG